MKTFQESIREILIKNGWGFRQFFLNVQSLDPNFSSSRLSKIQRGIQNPKDRKEFETIIAALGITDLTEIKELEKQAMVNIPIKKITEEELVQHLPLMINADDLTEEKLEKLKDMIKKSQEPDE